MEWNCPECEYSADELMPYSIHYAKSHGGNAFVAHEGEQHLKDLYQEKSRTEIANDYGVTVKVITSALESIDVEFRSHSEATKKYYEDHGLHDGNDPKDPYLTHHSQGYEEIRHWQQRIYVHRLSAIAWFGYDAVKDQHVHHCNNIPWDNREENLEAMSESEHRSHHSQEMWDDGVFDDRD